MTFARKKEKSLIIVRATVRQPDFRISERTLLRIGREQLGGYLKIGRETG